MIMKGRAIWHGPFADFKTCMAYVENSVFRDSDVDGFHACVFATLCVEVGSRGTSGDN